MRVEKSDQVYAYGTEVTVSRTVEEIRHMLVKYRAEGFAHVISPNPAGGAYVAFVINSRAGKFPVRVNVPQIFLHGRYLERESYRAALLIIKSKFTEIDCGEPSELVFLANMPSRVREQLLPRVDDLPMLEDGGNHGT